MLKLWFSISSLLWEILYRYSTYAFFICWQKNQNIADRSSKISNHVSKNITRIWYEEIWIEICKEREKFSKISVLCLNGTFLCGFHYMLRTEYYNILIFTSCNNIFGRTITLNLKYWRYVQTQSTQFFNFFLNIIRLFFSYILSDCFIWHKNCYFEYGPAILFVSG